MTCKDCKYWRRGGRYDHVDLESGCEIVRIAEKSAAYDRHGIGIITDEEKKTGMCVHPANLGDYARDWLKLPMENPVRYDGVRDEGERSAINFGEDFGCIHFQPK